MSLRISYLPMLKKAVKDWDNDIGTVQLGGEMHVMPLSPGWGRNPKDICVCDNRVAVNLGLRDNYMR